MSAPLRSAGLLFRQVIASAGTGAIRKPIQVLGAVNAYTAMLAESAGARALYLSGSGVATASHGLPDLGITDLHDVIIDAARVTRATPLPLLVDIDTGFGGAFGIARTIRELERVGVAAVHIEDQVVAKRCGHRPNKQIVSTQEMVDRIKAAVDARTDPNFVIMARSDALANEGLDAAIARARAYIAAGADMLFPEAFTKLEDYKALYDALQASNFGRDIPILANITEFGQTPLYSVEELGQVGVSLVLYPLTAFRAQSKAALDVYTSVIQNGHQRDVIDKMQTRKELYGVLKYQAYEDKLDALFGKNNKDQDEKSK